MKYLLVALVATVLTTVQAKEFRFCNNIPGPIWVASQGNPGFPAPNNGGWIMTQGQTMSLYTQDNWQGRFWARTWCNPDTNHCETGDCGNKLECNGAGGVPPATLAEFTLQGNAGLDFYDVSLVDGYNCGILIEPQGGQSDGGQYSCVRTGCTYNINQDCPQELQQIGSSGQVIACKSACEAFNTDEYCCRNAHNTPETCRSSDWPVDYPKHFKDRCPDAYSYAYDDHKSTFTCNAPVYQITFS